MFFYKNVNGACPIERKTEKKEIRAYLVASLWYTKKHDILTYLENNLNIY